MKARIYLSALLLCLLLITSCDDSGEYPYRMSYLPVQLEGSAKWSILDVNSGEVVIRDRFDRSPSTVVNGMFYYVNDDGTVTDIQTGAVYWRMIVLPAVVSLFAVAKQR